MFNHDFLATVGQGASHHLMQQSFGFDNSTSHNGTSHTEQKPAGAIGTFLMGVAPAITILGAVMGSHLVRASLAISKRYTNISLRWTIYSGNSCSHLQL